MLKLHHEDTLRYYIENYKINNMFEINLNSHMELHCFNKNELIVLKDSFPDYLYFFVEGTAVKLENLYNNNDIVKASTENLNVLGSLELFTQNKFEYSLRALDECICIAIPLSIIKDIAFKDPTFLTYFCKTFANSIYNNSLEISFLNKEKDAI
jgi:signal-transduction protein with cAMP-binding, CBS, and nucleotidyltransferase domain